MLSLSFLYYYGIIMGKDTRDREMENPEMEGGLMKTIITIQHTQSVHHTNGMMGSWTDWELSELGVRQAKRIGERNLGRCCGKSVRWMRENMEMREKSIDDRMFSDAESRRDEWNRLRPFFDEMMNGKEDNIIIVSHGDLLSVFYTMFLGLSVETINTGEIFGLAGGVSHMFENEEGKRFIKRISDMSYLI